jgi:hypothetical protein
MENNNSQQKFSNSRKKLSNTLKNLEEIIKEKIHESAIITRMLDESSTMITFSIGVFS